MKGRYAFINLASVLLWRCTVVDVTVNPAEEGTQTFFLPGGAPLEMVLIPAGTFTMGSLESETGRESDEGPQHEVTITRPFYLSKYELTEGRWASVMGVNLEGAGVEEYPVAFPTWDEAQEFIARLNAAVGTDLYRLPTEAEWEYACRAGTTTAYSFGNDPELLDRYAWYVNSRVSLPQPVGRKLPNAWGLYDMHGNVWEWCQDWYGTYPGGPQVDPIGPSSGTQRSFRGGSYFFGAQFARCAFRGIRASGRRGGYTIGLRLVRLVE